MPTTWLAASDTCPLPIGVGPTQACLPILKMDPDLHPCCYSYTYKHMQPSDWYRSQFLPGSGRPACSNVHITTKTALGTTEAILHQPHRAWLPWSMWGSFSWKKEVQWECANCAVAKCADTLSMLLLNECNRHGKAWSIIWVSHYIHSFTEETVQSPKEVFMFT